MAQHDQVIDNASGLAVRTDINAAMAALFSSNSGTLEPTVKVAGQLWFDTTTAPGTIKIRNSANNAWIVLGALSSVGMSTGLRASPDRWVVNDAADLSGNDLFWVLDTSGNVTIRERMSIIETDGSVRALFLVGMGADPGSLYCVVYNASGVEVNRWWMTSTGLYISQGGLKFSPAGGVLRGQIVPDLVGVPGRLILETYTNAPVLDGSAILSAAGLALNLAGDFHISRSSVIRANFGWDATLGSYLRHRDAAGAINGELDVAPAGASLQYGNYRWVTTGGVLRAHIGAERAAAGGLMTLETINNAAAADGSVVLSAGGLALNLAGDFYIYRGGVSRANFGWGATGAYMRYRDAAGAVANDVYLDATGLKLQIGGYRLESAGVLRGQILSEKSLAAGRMDLNTYNNAGALDGQALLTASGLILSLTGDFVIYRSGFSRANFGWDATLGTYMRLRDAAGALTGELDLRGFALALKGASGSQSQMRFEDASYVKRGGIEVDIRTTDADAHLSTFDNTGAVISRVSVKPDGLHAVYPGVADGKVFDTGWFPKGQGVGLNEVDFPVGTDLFFVSNDAQITNRNQVVTMRAGSTLRCYQLNGSDPLLTGTWINCGSQSPGANVWWGTARRVA